MHVRLISVGDGERHKLGKRPQIYQTLFIKEEENKLPLYRLQLTPLQNKALYLANRLMAEDLYGSTYLAKVSTYYNHPS